MFLGFSKHAHEGLTFGLCSILGDSRHVDTLLAELTACIELHADFCTGKSRFVQ